MPNIRVLLTGGGGFIGSAFLLKCPQYISVLSIDHGKNYKQLKSVVGKNIELVKGDIKDYKVLDKIMEKVDVVIHLAGGGGNRACLQDPTYAVLNNIWGTHLLMQKSKQYGVKRFVFASTQSVYGTFAERRMPLTENMFPKPDDFYGALKMLAEFELKESFNNYIIFRFANVYGYGSGLGAQWGGVIGKFIKSGFDNSELSVFGNGEQRIDFIHIDDVVQIILEVLKNNNITNEVINVGSGNGYRVKDIAMIVCEVGKKKFSKHIRLNSVLAPPDKIWPDRWLSIKKAKELLNWAPKTLLEEGIYKMMKKYI